MKPRIHALNAGLVLAACDMPAQVPMSIGASAEGRFRMLLAAEGEGQEVEALVYFEGDSGAGDLWLRIGLHSVGHADELREGPKGPEEETASRTSKIAVFRVPAGVIRDGRNELVIRSERVDATILGIDVCVR